MTNRPPGRTKELDRRFPEPETGAKKRIIFGLSTGILEEPQEAVQTPAEPVAGTGSEAKPAAPKNNTATPPAPQKKLPPVPGPVQQKPDDQEPGEVALTPSAKVEMQAELQKRENIIRQGLDAWWATSTALMEIRDQRLYVAAGFTDFRVYCRERLNAGPSTIHRKIAIGEVYAAVSPVGDTKPTSERQLRPLLALRQPGQPEEVWSKNVADVWAKVVEDANVLKTPITEKRVKLAMHQMELGPKPVQAVEVQPVDFDPQARWEALEAYLTHEREFWPSEHLGYLTDHLRVRLQAWEEDFRQAEEDRLEKRTVKDISLAGVGSYVRNDDLASYYGFEPDDHCRDPHIVFLIEHGYLGYERDYYAGYYEVVKLLPSKEEFVLTCGGPVKDISLAVVGSIVSEHALEDYYGTRDWRHQMYFKELSGLEKFEDRDYSRTWGHYHCFKIKGPLPSKEEFGPACEAWLKKYDEEREAERARNEAEEVARIAEEDRQEKAALAAETPGTPMHKLRQLRQDVEDSKAKLFEASAKVQSVCEEHRRLEEAERAGEEAQKSNPNTKPKSKAQAKRDEKAKEAIRQGRAKIRGKAHDDEDKARQALADARTAVAAFEVNEIAKTCKRGRDLPTAQVGETVVIQEVKKFYKDHCLLVLEGYLANKDGETDSPDSLLKVLRPLPTLEEFRSLKTEQFTAPLSEVVHRAYEMIEDEKNDLQCTQDDASEAAQESEAYANRQEKIDDLDRVSEPEVPESMDEITIYCEPVSESLRSAEKVLELCLQAINEDGGQHSSPAEAEALTRSITETISTLANL